MRYNVRAGVIDNMGTAMANLGKTTGLGWVARSRPDGYWEITGTGTWDVPVELDSEQARTLAHNLALKVWEIMPRHQVVVVVTRLDPHDEVNAWMSVHAPRTVDN
jgi:transposase